MFSTKKIVVVHQLTRWHRFKGLAFYRIDFEVKEKECILICGKNKIATKDLYRTLIGLEKPDEGHIIINGSWSVVPDNFPYLHSLSIKDYITLTLELNGKNSNRDYVRKLIEILCLTDKINISIQYYSEFDRCVLMLLLASISNPQLIIIGDCLQWLDNEELSSFNKYLKKIVHLVGCSVICF